MFIFYEAKTGRILHTVLGDELPAVLEGAWLKVDDDPGDLSLLCVVDGRLAPHPEAPARQREALRNARREAFAAETDPMIGKVLRGEITLSSYERACAEIRHRHPYPEEQI